MSTSPQIYQTTFGFNNSGAWDPLTISLAPKNSREYDIVINGTVVDDITIPSQGQSSDEPVQWSAGILSLNGTFMLSLYNDRYWLMLVNPDIVRGNWSGLTDGTSAVGGAYVIATWTGAYQTP